MSEELELEKSYSAKQSAAKLRRLADSLESEEAFHIQVDGKKITVPPSATVSIEYEAGDGEEELEFEIKWKS